MGESAGESQIFLSTLQPERRKWRLAVTAVLVSVAIFVAVLPFVQVQLTPVWGFIPVYESAIVVIDLITAGLLIGQFAILGSKALLALATGYLFIGCMAAAHMLTFPGLFATTGLLGAGPQSTAWLYMFWHAGFPPAVIAYALLERDQRAHLQPFDRPAIPILFCAAATVLATCGFTILVTAGHDLLPPIMVGQHYTPTMVEVVTSVWASSVLALAMLWRRRPHSVLDLWLMVVMCAWILDVALAAVFNRGRFDVGFYAGRVYGLLAASCVLLALLFENGKLYARVVHALEGERMERRLVQEKTAELNEANELLEQRVAARTAQLVASNRELRREVVDREHAEAALAKSREERREVAAISSTAREQEKRRIARELHDELAQALTTFRMDLGWLRDRTPDENAAVVDRIARMHDVLEGTAASIRRIASELRPMMLDDLGLVSATQWLVENFRQRHGIACELLIDPSAFDLADPHATAAFRILQESLSNIARHAHASRVEIRLDCKDRQLLLIIRDNGVGFDPSSPRKVNSFGLVGVRERAYLVDGQLNINTSPGRGTTIEVRIPLPGDTTGVVAQPGGMGESAA